VKDSLGQVVGKYQENNSLFRQVGTDPLQFSVNSAGFLHGGVH
jgi:hypothetical protein